MNTIERARFVKLIEFLEGLPRQRFNFAQVVTPPCETGECGTVGCAIGLTPELFPELVRWTSDKTGLVDVQSGKRIDYASAASDLFGIHGGMANDLFCPDEQREVHGDLDNCDEFAAPGEVAFMLNQFLAMVDSGDIDPWAYDGGENLDYDESA